jgi:predicted nucleic acid-binding protein
MGRWQTARIEPAREDPRETDRPDRHREPPLRLYLDTIALLKIYVAEQGSDLIKAHVADASLIASSSIAYVEARSALARRRAAGDIPSRVYRRLVGDFDADWDRYVRIEVSETLVRRAAGLAARHRLRAYDSIHLASALLLRERPGDDMIFASWDKELDGAAAREGLRLLR